MKKGLQRTILLLIIVFAVHPSFAQSPHFHLNQVLSFIGQEKQKVVAEVKKAGYSYQGREENTEIYTLTSPIENSTLLLSFRSGKLSVFSWSENLIYANRIIADIISSNLELVEVMGHVRRYEDKVNGYQLNFFDHSYKNIITVVISRKWIPVQKPLPKPKPKSSEAPKNTEPKIAAPIQKQDTARRVKGKAVMRRKQD